MGMYDTFNMKVMMPDCSIYDEDFESKDLDCNLDRYVVTPDGRLMRQGEDHYEPHQLTGEVYMYGPINITAHFKKGRLTHIVMER